MVVLLGALFACRSKAHGHAKVDSQAFNVRECHSGEGNVPSFTGVDLADGSGRKLRFARHDGHLRLFLFEPGSTRGTLIGEDCGTMALSHHDDSVGGVHEVDGSASAHCKGNGHNIVVDVQFEHCH